MLTSSEQDYHALQGFSNAFFEPAFQPADTQAISPSGSPPLVDTASFLPPGWSQGLGEHGFRSPLDQISGISEMDWDAIMSMASAGHDRPLSTSPRSPSSFAPPLSPLRPLFDQTTPLNRLQRLPEDSSADFSPSDNGSASTSPPSQRMTMHGSMPNRPRRSLPLDYSRQSGSSLSAQGRSASSSSPALRQPMRRPSGTRTTSGTPPASMRGRATRAGGDRSSVRQLYATSHGRGYSDHVGHSVDGSVPTRRRAGTTSGSQSDVSSQDAGHLRTTTSMPLIEDHSGPAAGSLRHGHPSMPPEGYYMAQSASRASDPSIRDFRREQEGLAASITDDFESLGLDLGSLPGVLDVAMGEGLGPSDAGMRRSSTQYSAHTSPLGPGGGIHLSPSASSQHEGSLPGETSLPPSTASRRYPSYLHITQTPLSSPDPITYAPLLLSPGHSGTPSNLRPPQGYHSNPAATSKGKATEFGVGLDAEGSKSAINSWPRTRPPPVRSPSSTISHIGVQQRLQEPSGDQPGSSRSHLAPRSSLSDPASAVTAASGFSDERNSVHTSKSAEPLSRSERVQMASLPSPTTVSGKPGSSRKATRPMSMDGLSSSARPGRMTDPVSGGLVSPGNRSRKIDYSQVSAALDTLRTFLRQRESANFDPAVATSPEAEAPGPVAGQRFTSSEVGTSSSASRTLRHKSGQLPPRGSIRVDDVEEGALQGQSSSDARRGGIEARDRRRQRSSVGSSSGVDGPFRENDRLEALQHLAERVRALRQQSSMQHREDGEGHPGNPSGPQ